MQREGGGVARERAPGVNDAVRRLVEGTVLVAALSIPLVFAPYTEHVFEPAKASIVRFFGIVVLGAGALIVGRRIRPADPSRAVVAALVAVWLAEAVATVLSPVPWLGLMGAPDRGQGLLTVSAITVLGLAAVYSTNRPGGAWRLTAWMAAAALPVSLYAIGQYGRWSIDPLPWAGDTMTRVAGPAGNSVMLAAHLALVLPLAIAVAALAWKRIAVGGAGGLAIWCVVALSCAAALVASGSRGPALALAGGLFAALLAVAASRRNRKAVLSLAAVAAAGIGLVIGLNVAAGSLGPLESVPFVARLSQALNPERSTTRVRLRLWEGSAEAIAAAGPRLIAGYGPESMSAVWAPYYPSVLAYDEPRGFVPDRAHNLAFDDLITTGALGLLAHLLLFTAVVETGLAVLGLFSGTGWLSVRTWRVAWLAGGVIGGAAAWAAGGPRMAGLGLGLGLAAGLATWLVGVPFFGRSTATERDAATTYLVAGLLAAAVAHLLELQVSFPTIATRLGFVLIAATMAGMARSSTDDDHQPASSGFRRRADTALAAFVVGATLAHAFARPGLVAGGGIAAIALTLAAAAGAAYAIWSAGPAIYASRHVGETSGQARVAGWEGRTGPAVVACGVGLAAAAVFALLQLSILSYWGDAASGSLITSGMFIVGFAVALGIALAAWARASSSGGTYPAARPGTPGRTRLVAAYLIAIWVVATTVAAVPIVAEAVHKEGRLVWLPLAQRARAEREAGRAEAFFAQAGRRFNLASRLAPWSPEPLLSLGRLETERADNLDEQLARLAVGAGTATLADEYGPAVPDGVVELVDARDMAFARSVAAIDRADALWAPSPGPALTRARALRVWAERTRAPAQRAERLAAAADAYEVVMRRAPHWPEVFDEAAWVSLLEDAPSRALTLTDRALAMDVYFLRANRTAASAHANLGDDRAAAEAFAAYFSDDRNTGDLPALRGQLAALLRLGRGADALPVGESVALLAPDDAHAQADLAVLREAVGDVAGALSAAERASTLAPSDKGIAALVNSLRDQSHGAPSTPESGSPQP